MWPKATERASTNTERGAPKWLAPSLVKTCTHGSDQATMSRSPSPSASIAVVPRAKPRVGPSAAKVISLTIGAPTPAAVPGSTDDRAVPGVGRRREPQVPLAIVIEVGPGEVGDQRVGGQAEVAACECRGRFGEGDGARDLAVAAGADLVRAAREAAAAARERVAIDVGAGTLTRALSARACARGIVEADVVDRFGDLFGDVFGDLCRHILGDVFGDLGRHILGDVLGDVFGDLCRGIRHIAGRVIRATGEQQGKRETSVVHDTREPDWTCDAGRVTSLVDTNPAAVRAWPREEPAR